MKIWPFLLILVSILVWTASAQDQPETPKVPQASQDAPDAMDDLEVEGAASTNETEVVGYRLPVGENRAPGHNRTKGDSSALSQGFDAGALLSKAGLAKPTKGVTRAPANFSAVDNAADDTYMPDNVESWLGRNGGNGFDAWTRMGGNATSFTTDFRDADPGIGDNDGDFTLGVAGGEAIVGRHFVDGNGTVVLGTGTFTVRGWLNSSSESEFLGFAVLDGGNNELLRWGWGTGKNAAGQEGREGLVYRVENGDYMVLDEEGWDSYVDYTLSWERQSGVLQFTLTGTSAGGVLYEWIKDSPVSVEGAESVGGIAVVAGGGSQGAPAQMAFDKVSATGVIVPEPGTLALLATGLAGLLARRRRKN